MSTLKINLLGPFSVFVDGQPAAGFASDKVRALLAFLAAEHDKPHRRDYLAGLLWPGSSQKQARTSLRRALANLRKVIGDHQADPTFLTITPQTIQFNVGPAVALDLAALQAARAGPVDQVEQPLEQFAGRFMTGFSLPDSAAFEEWILVQEEHYRRQATEFLTRVVNFYSAEGAPLKALPYAWGLVELDPWLEEGQRVLIRLLVQTGQRGAALRQVNIYRAQLISELGVDLDPQTAALWEWIQAGDAVEDQEFDSSARLQPAVIGRKAELAALKKLFIRTQSGTAQIGLVTGDAGSGKSTLIHTFLDRLNARHPSLLVLEGHGQDHVGQSDPYGPWVSAFDSLFDGAEPFLVEALLDHAPDLIEAFVFSVTLRKIIHELPDKKLAERLSHVIEIQMQRPAKSKGRLLRETACFLRAVALHRPLVMVLDDVQWADPDSIDLLSHLSHQTDLGQILFLVAWRPTGVASHQLDDPSGDNGRHPLVEVAHLLQQRGASIVDLDAANGRDFIDALLDQEPNRLPENFRSELFLQTAGHPLFTIELVTQMKRCGQLQRNHKGVWEVKKEIDWAALPQRIEAVLAEKTGRLSERQAIYLTIASAAGEPFAAELVARVADVSEREMVSILSGSLTHDHQLLMLQKCQFLGQQRLSLYRFRYSTCRTFLYGRLDEAERAYLHEKLAEALISLIPDQADGAHGFAGQIARHFLKAGRPERAMAYFSQAGSQAVRLAAFSHALNYYQQGLRLVEQLSDETERNSWELKFQLAQGVPLLSLKGYNAPEVADVYGRALALVSRVRFVDRGDQVKALFWLTSFYAVSSHYQQSLNLAGQMIDLTAGQDEDAIAFVLAHVLSGVPFYFMGRFEEAKHHFEQAVAAYRPEIHQKQVFQIGQDPGVSAYCWLAMICAHSNQRDKADQYAKKALDISMTLDHPYTRAFVLLIAGLSPPLFFQAYADPAGVAAVKELANLAEIHDFKSFQLYANFYGALFNAHAALSDRDQKGIDCSIEQMEAALEAERRAGHVAGLSSRLILLAEVYQLAARPDDGLLVLDQAEKFVNQTGERYFEPELHRLRAELLLFHDPGDTAGEAGRALESALAVAQSQGAALFEHRAEVVSARLPGSNRPIKAKTIGG